MRVLARHMSHLCWHVCILGHSLSGATQGTLIPQFPYGNCSKSHTTWDTEGESPSLNPTPVSTPRPALPSQAHRFGP